MTTAAPLAPLLPTQPIAVDMTYSLVIKDYPGSFGIDITIPVLEDGRLKLDQALKARAKIGTPFSFSIEEAIRAAQRHLFIRSATGLSRDNPEQVVEDWLNLLRWEVRTFWTARPQENWYGETDNADIYITSEHPRRSGEMLAEGIAVLFAEKRLRISRSKIFFYKDVGNKARPDFVFGTKTTPRLGIVLNGRKLYGLEVRSRNAIQSVHADDHESLRGKKRKKKNNSPNLSGIVAMYCSYGPPSAARKIVASQIILADPKKRLVKLDRIELFEVLCVHYIGVTSRIGLWSERDALEQALIQLRKHRVPTLSSIVVSPSVSSLLPQRVFGSESYRGRLFSTLLIQFQRGEITREQAFDMFKQGAVGDIVFHGVNETALEFIKNLDFKSLEKFFDVNVKNSGSETSVGADGSIMMRRRPDEQDLTELRSQFDRPPVGHDAIVIDLDADI